MYPHALTPMVASLVFSTSVAPSYAYADEFSDLGGDESAHVGARYEVPGFIETPAAPIAATYHGARPPASTAFAPAIIASEDTCMGSRSFGLQLAGFGVSFATTWQDRQCRRIKNARQLDALGYRRAAVALLCQDDEVFNAMQRAGTPCPGLELVDVSTPPPPPAPEAEPPLVSFDNVLFDFDRSTLRPEADAVLEPVLAMLQADPGMAVEIEGHTDWIGSDAYNDGLSHRRAQAVVEWLVAQGIARDRLLAQGRGESEPVATNQTRAGRQLNRRTEVRRRPVSS